MKKHIMINAAAALAAVAFSAHAGEASAPVTRLADSSSLEWGPCPTIFGQGCEITVLNGDPAKPDADILLRTPGGSTLAAHTHTSSERMILISGELRVRYKGAEPFTMLAGAYAFGPAGLPHEATCESVEPCVLFIAFDEAVDANAFDGPLD